MSELQGLMASLQSISLLHGFFILLAFMCLGVMIYAFASADPACRQGHEKKSCSGNRHHCHIKHRLFHRWVK